jgi:uncharacterized protein
LKISVAPLLKQPYGATETYDVSEDVITERSEHAGLLDAGVFSVSGQVVGTHTNPGVYAQGNVMADAHLECSRCLRSFDDRLAVRFGEQYYATIDVLSGARLPEPPRDAYTIGHDFMIDFTPLLREHIILEMPLKPLCEANCAGICVVCGADQNQRPHRHDPEPDERWSALRGMLAQYRPEQRD